MICFRVTARPAEGIGMFGFGRGEHTTWIDAANENDALAEFHKRRGYTGNDWIVTAKDTTNEPKADLTPYTYMDDTELFTGRSVDE